MFFPAGIRRSGSICVRLLLAGLALALIGCSNRKPKSAAPAVASRYQQLPPKKVPEYLKGTIMERVELDDTTPYPVSGYGLVANLNGTGDTRSPNAVREYMIKIMEKRGFGSRQLGYGAITPERVLSDPRFAIVRVDGFIPAGARVGQRFDVQVSALRDNNTTSLADGQLYRTELKVDGANPRNPGMAIEVPASAEGDIFVNPAYALETIPEDSAARLSLRTGVVLGGGVVRMDRPLTMRVRQPSYATARGIEQRLDDFLQNDSFISARDDGIIVALVPPKYGDDWEHFAGVITHVFFNATPSFVLAKAEQLAQEAVKPDAPLKDISYCWEAMGSAALPFVTPLMTHPQPEVAFAAARAAAFIGDAGSRTVLIEMARQQGNPFQLNAVQVLAKLPNSPEINTLLRTLLNSQHTLVRLESYKALTRAADAAVFSRVIEQKFWLDIVTSDGPPMIYATRRGMPRLAIFGRKPALKTPVTFTAMNGKFSISSEEGKTPVTIYYRGPEVRRPVTVLSNPDIAELAARLAGAGPLDEPRLNFTYCDVVAILQALVDQEKVVAPRQPTSADRVPVAFVLQDLPFALDPVYDAPALPGPQKERPQSDSPGTVSSATAGNSNVEIRNPKE